MISKEVWKELNERYEIEPNANMRGARRSSFRAVSFATVLPDYGFSSAPGAARKTSEFAKIDRKLGSIEPILVIFRIVLTMSQAEPELGD